MQQPYPTEALRVPDVPHPDPGGTAGRRSPGGASAPPAPTDTPTPVAVHGELDLTSGTRVRDQLAEALAASASGLELDLSGLVFCDCAGLNVLLEIRHRAVSQGKTVTIRAAGAAVDRLLDVTGVRELFASRRARAPHPRHRGTALAPQPPHAAVSRARHLSLCVSDPL